MKFKTMLLVCAIIMLICLPPVKTVAETLTLVPPTQTVLATGDTLITQVTVDADNPSVIHITQEVQTLDSLRHWKLVTNIYPDSTGDHNPELSISYTPVKMANPFDVNQDGVVNGRDFWTLFSFLFWRP
jgi:hypothetical protein